MNANRQFDEDDLVLYAMRLLAEPEQAEVSAYVAGNPTARQRVAELEATLATYAEAAVEPEELPSGSLERLLARVEAEGRSAGLPIATASGTGATAARGPALVPKPKLAGSPLGADREEAVPTEGFRWGAALGWAIAALLAVAAGITLQQRSSLHGELNSRDTQIAALSSDVDGLRHERDTLRSSLASGQQQLANSSAELAAQQSEAATLKSEAEHARSNAANLSGKTSQLTSQLGAEQARAAAAEQEKNRLQGTLAAQADQLAALESTTTNAEVMATLTDPSALRVVLTQPKSKPVPTGRAAYVASKGSLVFLASNFEPPKANKVYELWLLPASGASPVPAGTFVPDAKGNAHVVYTHFPGAVPAKGFAVTLENSGGATTPTMPLLLVGS